MEKQNGKTLSRKHLFALWGTLITVLGTAVVPKVIDALSDRPSVVDVQDMIAKQTKALTAATKRNIATIEKLRDVSVSIQTQLAKVEGCVETVEKIVRDCCTRPGRHGTLRPTVSLVEHKKLFRKLEKSQEKKGGGVAKEATLKKSIMKMVHDAPSSKKLPEFEVPWLQQEQR